MNAGLAIGLTLLFVSVLLAMTLIHIRVLEYKRDLHMAGYQVGILSGTTGFSDYGRLIERSLGAQFERGYQEGLTAGLKIRDKGILVAMSSSSNRRQCRPS